MTPAGLIHQMDAAPLEVEAALLVPQELYRCCLVVS